MWLRRDTAAAASLTILCENVNPVKVTIKEI